MSVVWDPSLRPLRIWNTGDEGTAAERISHRAAARRNNINPWSWSLAALTLIGVQIRFPFAALCVPRNVHC
jgi:hypothetical protein